ncbi:MAG: acetyltransferase [Firmicutes bacterium]|nr:acetyltransferase [Bacillota bacterium]
MRKVVLIGAGGHAKVVIELLKKTAGIEILGLIEKDASRIGKKLLGVPVLGTDEQFGAMFDKESTYALITVGSVGDNSLRKKLYDNLKNLGFNYINAIHPSAFISEYAALGEGNTLMAGSMIGPGAEIGNNVIVNTGSIIEHDCRIGNHVHIAPGVTLSGGVQIGNCAHLGTGATVIQNINIGANCLIGAGTVVISDVPDNAVMVGNPGRVIKFR